MTMTLNGSGTITGLTTLTNTNTITSAAATALTLQSGSTTAVTIDTNQNVGIGVTSPETKLEMAGSTSNSWIVTASVATTVMTVTAVTSGTIAVGDLVFGVNIQPYTRVTALGTGTGGTGTYTVSVSQTSASATVNGGASYGNTLIRITNQDAGEAIGQPTGGLQFYTKDVSSPGEGVGAYIAAVAESITPDTSLVFGTRDNAVGGVDANERMRIDSSGNLLVGTTTSQGKITVLGANGGTDIAFTNTSGTALYYACAFYNTGTTYNFCGGITVSGTTTTYATSSDYRLKEAITPMTGALAKVIALKPVTYKWKLDGSDSQGFIAHELQAIVPECVVGEKDAVDADGKPQYQGIDTSFLVATLTAAIQEQQALITSLTTRITALENK